jgi:hypothetical protein
MGGRESTYNRRLLRVGVPFGNSLPNRYTPIHEDPEKGNRGLLFLSIQASIERQFEFLVGSWANMRHVLVVVLVLDLLGLGREEGSIFPRLFCSVSVTSRILEHDDEHEHDFSTSVFRINRRAPRRSIRAVFSPQQTQPPNALRTVPSRQEVNRHTL